MEVLGGYIANGVVATESGRSKVFDRVGSKMDSRYTMILRRQQHNRSDWNQSSLEGLQERYSEICSKLVDRCASIEEDLL